MNMKNLILVPLLAGVPLPLFAAGGDADTGARMWVAEQTEVDAAQPRSCATCHTDDLRRAGKHAKTGKAIEPMAPSVNPARLSDAAKVEKWFLRNCKWTLGRECNAAEKADFLAFIRSQ